MSKEEIVDAEVVEENKKEEIKIQPVTKDDIAFYQIYVEHFKMLQKDVQSESMIHNMIKLNFELNGCSSFEKLKLMGAS